MKEKGLVFFSSLFAPTGRWTVADVGWVLRTHAAVGDSWRPITRACGARTLQLFFPFRPGGAMDCSHGWSVGAAQQPDAEPVESG